MATNNHNHNPNPEPDPIANSSASSHGSIIPPADANTVYPCSSRTRFPTNYNLRLPDLPLPYDLYHRRPGPIEDVRPPGGGVHLGDRVKEYQSRQKENAAKHAREDAAAIKWREREKVEEERREREKEREAEKRREADER